MSNASIESDTKSFENNLSENDSFEISNVANSQLNELSNSIKPVSAKYDNQSSGDESIEIPDEYTENTVSKFSTIMNMEKLKRALFNGEFDVFSQSVQGSNLKLYDVKYKYDSENDGKQSYMAGNLLRGFVRNFDEYRKYFLIAFRCIIVDPDKLKYEYPSVWIVNSLDPINEIIGSFTDDFEFVEVNKTDQTEVKNYLQKFQKMYYLNNMIDETFVH